MVTVIVRTGIVRFGLAAVLAATGWLAGGCSGSSGPTAGPSAGPGGEGGPQASATDTGPLPSGTVTGPASAGTAAGQQTSPGAAPGPSGTGVAGQSPGAAGPRPSGAAAGRPPRMPNLVGRNLQDAQDALRAAGVVFFATTHDATGRNRPRTLDLFWKVCSQTPRTGQPVPKGVVPDVGIVATDEPCP
jgi:hypothetical protein